MKGWWIYLELFPLLIIVSTFGGLLISFISPGLGLALVLSGIVEVVALVIAYRKVLLLNHTESRGA